MADERKSDFSRAFSEDGALKTHVGGQALLEGIMMRGKYNWAVAVREPEGGVYTEEHDLASGRACNGWLYWPVVRGCRAFVESLMLGYKALEIAAAHAFVEEDEAGAEPVPLASRDEAAPGEPVSLASDDSAPSASREPVSPSTLDETVGKAEKPPRAVTVGKAEKPPRAVAAPFSWKDDFGRPDTVIDALGAQHALEVVSVAPSVAEEEANEKKPLLGSKEMAVSMAIGLVLGVVLFIVAPAFVTNLIVGEYDSNALAWNIVDGILRIAVFVFYIWLIGRMEDIQRMFGYHGAEHKTIHCFEHGLPLTPEHARSFPRLHVRCGTAFLIMVMIVAIFVYTVVPLGALIEAWGVPDGAPKLALVIVARIVLMPVIAGLSYEVTVKWAGSHPENPLVKVILWPGLQMQYLTTREPDDGQIECAIAAMRLVLEREQAEEAQRVAAVPSA